MYPLITCSTSLVSTPSNLNWFVLTTEYTCASWSELPRDSFRWQKAQLFSTNSISFQLTCFIGNKGKINIPASRWKQNNNKLFQLILIKSCPFGANKTFCLPPLLFVTTARKFWKENLFTPVEPLFKPPWMKTQIMNQHLVTCSCFSFCEYYPCFPMPTLSLPFTCVYCLTVSLLSSWVCTVHELCVAYLVCENKVEQLYRHH